MSDHSRKSQNKSKRNQMPQPEDMVDRLAKIEFANPVCADCPNGQPRWASFLKDKHPSEEGEGDENTIKSEALKVEKYLSVMVCDDCAIKHHNELGAKRCKLKCLECFHEWSHEEADIVLTSGNALVNAIYEANLQAMGDFDKEVVVTDNAEVEDDRRSKFIKNKYKKRKYRNDTALQNTLVKLEKHHHNLQQDPKSGSKSKTINNWLDSTHSKKSKSFLKLLRTSGHRGLSRATKAFNNSHNTMDSAPKRPDRCLSSASSSYQPSAGVSSITWSEGRSGYSVASDLKSDDDSISSWWDDQYGDQ